MNRRARRNCGVRREYDFSRGVRGKYARRYAAGTNLVLVDPDLRDVFGDSRSVNRALRAIADIVRSRRRTESAAGK